MNHNFEMNLTDPTQRHGFTPRNGSSSCPNCNRKSNKFASLLGRRFEYGKSCPNCHAKQQQQHHDDLMPNIQHSMSMPQSHSIPSTLVVPTPSFHRANWIDSDHQDDDNMTIISEITMDRALLLEPTKRGSQQTSSSSGFTHTTHLMAQEFTKSMDTLTEEEEDSYISNQRRFKHFEDKTRIREERFKSEEKEEEGMPLKNNSHDDTDETGKARISNNSNKTIEYTLDKIDKFDERIRSYQKRGCSRSPSRSLPPPDNTAMYIRAPSPEERLSRSYNDKELHHEPERKFGIQKKHQQSRDASPHKQQTDKLPTSARKQSASIKDIPIVLKCVEMYPTKNCIERAFQTLFLLSTESDPMGRLARREIISRRGFELLHDSLQRHEKDADGILALLNALWALCFFHGSDDETKEVALKKVQELQLVDQVMHTLESHAENVQIQEVGFDLIHRFIDLLPPIELKSAIGTILCNTDIIAANTDAFAMGLDTLKCLCQLFDDSKLQVANGLTANGGILDRLLDRSTNLKSQEGIFQLLWVVTSITESVSVLSENAESIINHIIVTMEEVPRSYQTVLFHESGCGILANMAMLETNHAIMNKLGVVSIICEEIYAYECHSAHVLNASCTALANLSVSTETRALLIAEDGVTALLFSMKSAPDNLEVQCEAMRALNKLTESPTSFGTGMNIIISTIICYSDSKYIQQIGCSILNKLSVNEKCRVALIASWGIFDALIKIQKQNASNKLIQNDIISLLRNLLFDQSVMPTILNRGFVEASIEALEAHRCYGELQENGCDLIWKLASLSPEAKIQIYSVGGIQCIVKAMQMLLESPSLQEIACKALYATILGSVAHKKIAISLGIIDTIICLILVHSCDVKVLDEAVNILNCLSTVDGCLSQIVENGGITAVVDAMHSNDSSVDLIIAASRFLRGAALEDGKLANNFTESIPAMLSCMDKHPESTEMLVICCETLKCFIAKSETCKKHLIASHGRSILEKILAEKKYKDIPGSSSVTVSFHSLLDEL